jgi:predicted nucleic acid-binding protein
MQAFVFDTYALLEIINGNSNYAKYLDCGIIINEFIFAELCYKFLREGQVEKSNLYSEKYKHFIMTPDAETIKEAMSFRADNKKKNLTATDCINYIMSKKLNIKLLTGDQLFEKMENVEFLK